MEVSGRLHAQAALSLESEPPVPTIQEAGWAPGPVWTRGEEKNSQPLPGLETPTIQPVVQLYNTELSRLLIRMA
jgi:hypothetical protein